VFNSWHSASARTALIYSPISLSSSSGFQSIPVQTQTSDTFSTAQASAYLYWLSMCCCVSNNIKYRKSCSYQFSKMGLLNLSNPLLLNVVIRLDTPESPDICNVTLVCKQFNLITTPLAYREVNMTPNWPVIMPEAGVPPGATSPPTPTTPTSPPPSSFQ
jgi:hypothetical protein